MVTLKPNMYVRFKDNKDIQYIGKLININEYREPCFKYAIEVTWYDDYIFVGDNDIIGEPSFDLIDLIEVGDYVNGYKVLFIDVFFSEGKNVKCINNEEERVCFYEEDIKDIITKEQFNSMKYVVERDK